MLYAATKRTEIVNRLLNINLSAKEELNDILRLVTGICGVSSGQISLLDAEKQCSQFWLNSQQIITGIEDTFCKYTMLSDDILEVPDTFLDARFLDHPAVLRAPYLRFYAGIPLQTRSGVRIGTLCIMDSEPGTLTDLQKKTLTILAHQVTTIFEFELSLAFLKEERDKVIETEAKLQSIFLHSPASHIVVNEDFRIVSFNKAANDVMQLFKNKSLQPGENFLSFIDSRRELFVKTYTMLLMASAYYLNSVSCTR